MGYRQLDAADSVETIMREAEKLLEQAKGAVAATSSVSGDHVNFRTL